jgi:HK97 family phage portal protein
MEDLISKAWSLFNQADTPVPYTSSRGGSGASLFASDSGLPIGERAYDAYGSVGTLFAIVTQLMNAVSSTEWHLYRRTSVRDKKRRTEVLGHGFMTVWDMPNPFYTGDMLREVVQQHLDLVGEGVIVLNKVAGVVIEMWPVRPDRIRPIKHPKKFLTGYMYVSPDGEEVPLTLDQVIHLKYPNPTDPYRGMGPVQTVLNDIDAAKYSAEWNRNFFINGARPGGIIEVDYRMEDKEFNEFIARWRQQHQGVANAHRVAVLENAKWVDTAFSMSDMQFIELRNLPRELIREAFAFPKPMLGTVDDVNRANSDAGKEILAENHTIPRLRRWKSVINTFLLPQFANGKALELDFDDPTPINHEAMDRERNSQTAGANKLVLSGYHPDDVTDAMGLPRMRWIGIPTPAYSTPEDEGDDNTEQANMPQQTTKRTKVRT